MNREQLITRVKSVIYQNDNNEIDAQKHQDLEIEIINTLLDAVGSVSSGFISTIQANAPAPTPQKNGYYIFSTAGTVPYIPGSPTVKVGDWLVVTYVGLNHTYNNVGKLLNLSDSFTISDSNVGASLKALYDGLQDLSTRLKNGSNLTIKDLENSQATANNRLDGLDLSVKNIGRWCNIVANESASNARLRIVPTLRRRGFQLERLGTDSVFVTEKYIGATLDDSEWSKDSNWIELETKNNKNKAGGYVGLDSNTLMQDNQIPNSVERVSKKNQPNGYAGLDADGMIIYSFKKYIGLEMQGDGLGYSRFRILTNKTGKVIIQGGEFRNLSNPGEIIGTELNSLKDSYLDIYVKLTSSTAVIEVDNMIYFNWVNWSSSANSPIIRMNINEIPNEFIATVTSGSKLYGRVLDIPRNTKSLSISSPVDSLYLTGDYRDLPRSLENLLLYLTNVSGDYKDLPRKITSLSLQNTKSSTTGLIKDLPYSSRINITGGLGVINGNIGDLGGTLSLLLFDTLSTSNNITYTGGIKATPAFDSIRIKPMAGVFTSAMTDQLLIDLAAQITSFVGSKTIDLTGNCGAPTSASSTARATLSGLGATVLTN